MTPYIDIPGLPPDSNPFSTRAIRPGALPFHYLDGVSSEQLLDRLRDQNWWGEILGPHGTGKSTLVADLLPRLEGTGRTVHHFSLHQGEKRLPIPGGALKSWDASTQVIVDGYEQLGGWRRSMLKRVCTQRGAGLLVTAHESVGFPLLLHTSVTLELTQRLVEILTEAEPPLLTPDDVERSFRDRKGNLREVFFELYDVYESRRRG